MYMDEDITNMNDDITKLNDDITNMNGDIGHYKHETVAMINMKGDITNMSYDR